MLVLSQRGSRSLDTSNWNPYVHTEEKTHSCPLPQLTAGDDALGVRRLRCVSLRMGRREQLHGNVSEVVNLLLPNLLLLRRQHTLLPVGLLSLTAPLQPHLVR